MKKIMIVSVITVLAAASVAGLYLYQELERVESDDPLVWLEAVNELEKKTQLKNPGSDHILFVGSSSIRFWETLEQDMSPLPVIQHGFGGAKIYDVVYFAEPLINRWKTEKIVIFVGSNDINGNDDHQNAPEHIAEQLEALFEIIFSENPEAEVFYIAITPTLYSWDKWQSVQKANQLAMEVCRKHEKATFISTEDLFLNEKGEPNKDLFVFDGLHLNKAGYALWTQRIKPYLTEK